jgi:mitochondrial GTPase 1
MKLRRLLSRTRVVRDDQDATMPSVNWFPGHMAKGRREIEDRVKSVDVLIEVRDARLPLSSANWELDEIGRHKHRMVVLNKRDLSERDRESDVNHFLMDSLVRESRQRGVQSARFDVRHVEASRMRAKEVKQFIGAATRLATANRTTRVRFVTMLVCGVPNVGKSTLLNALRRSKIAAVGKLPGVTRALTAPIQIGVDPATYLVDTPGIMMPRIDDVDVGMKLALTGAIAERRVDGAVLVDYGFAQFERRALLGRFVGAFQLNHVPSSGAQLIDAVAQRQGCSVEHAADRILRHFRAGRFGPILLDRIYRIDRIDASDSND